MTRQGNVGYTLKFCHHSAILPTHHKEIVAPLANVGIPINYPTHLEGSVSDILCFSFPDMTQAADYSQNIVSNMRTAALTEHILSVFFISTNQDMNY